MSLGMCVMCVDNDLNTNYGFTLLRGVLTIVLAIVL